MPVRPEHLHTAIELAKQYGARKLILFGSALEAPDKAHDLDLAWICLLMPVVWKKRWDFR
jgi:hypothetical protein